MRIETTAAAKRVIPARVSPPQSKEGFFMPHTQAHQPDHTRADFRVTYPGTVTTITPLTDACRECLEQNVEIDLASVR
jgi:hypothetical protein